MLHPSVSVSFNVFSVLKRMNLHFNMHVNRKNLRTASLGSDLLWKRAYHHGATDSVEDYSDMPGEYPENVKSQKEGQEADFIRRSKTENLHSNSYRSLHDMTAKVYSPN